VTDTFFTHSFAIWYLCKCGQHNVQTPLYQYHRTIELRILATPYDKGKAAALFVSLGYKLCMVRIVWILYIIIYLLQFMYQVTLMTTTMYVSYYLLALASPQQRFSTLFTCLFVHCLALWCANCAVICSCFSSSRIYKINHHFHRVVWRRVFVFFYFFRYFAFCPESSNLNSRLEAEFFWRKDRHILNQ